MEFTNHTITKVHLLYLAKMIPEAPEPRSGIVLAETQQNFVTWRVYRYDEDELWACETGHYYTRDDQGYHLARYDFGLRLAREMNATTFKAVYDRAREWDRSPTT